MPFRDIHKKGNIVHKGKHSACQKKKKKKEIPPLPTTTVLSIYRYGEEFSERWVFHVCRNDIQKLKEKNPLKIMLINSAQSARKLFLGPWVCITSDILKIPIPWPQMNICSEREALLSSKTFLFYFGVRLPCIKQIPRVYIKVFGFFQLNLG